MNYYKIFRLIVSITYLSVILCTELAAQQTARVFPEIPPSVLSVAMKDYKDGQDPMDSRLFRTTSTRKQINLSGFWTVETDRDSTYEFALRRWPVEVDRPINGDREE